MSSSRELPLLAVVVAPGKTILVFNQYVGFRVNYWEVLNLKGKQMTF